MSDGKSNGQSLKYCSIQEEKLSITETRTIATCMTTTLKALYKTLFPLLLSVSRARERFKAVVLIPLATNSFLADLLDQKPY